MRLASRDMLARREAPPGFAPGPLTFYAIPFFGILIFGTLIYFSYRNRSNPAAHKRLILIANIAILDARPGRPPFSVITAHPFMDNVVVHAFLLLLRQESLNKCRGSDALSRKHPSSTLGSSSVKAERELVQIILRDWISAFKKRDRVITEAEQLSTGLFDGTVDCSDERLDNRGFSGIWGEAVFQYLLFKKLFRVESGQITQVVERDYRDIFFNPSAYKRDTQEFLRTGASRGRSWIQYWFSEDDGFFYRLDWLNGFWGIRLRFYKENKKEADLQRMEIVADSLKNLMQKAGSSVAEFRRYPGKTETTCLYLDPAAKGVLSNLRQVHPEFMKRCFRVRLVRRQTAGR